jgi:hypothetical protein
MSFKWKRWLCLTASTSGEPRDRHHPLPRSPPLLFLRPHLSPAGYSRRKAAPPPPCRPPHHQPPQVTPLAQPILQASGRQREIPHPKTLTLIVGAALIRHSVRRRDGDAPTTVYTAHDLHHHLHLRHPLPSPSPNPIPTGPSLSCLVARRGHAAIASARSSHDRVSVYIPGFLHWEPRNAYLMGGGKSRTWRDHMA